MKKIKKSKNNSHHKIKVVGLTVLGILLAILISLQFWFNVFLSNRIQKLENDNLINLIQNSLEQMDTEPITDPMTNKKYIPDARIVLPSYPYNLTDGIVYTYNPSFEGSSPELQISSKTAHLNGINRLSMSTDTESLFSYVPEAQACSRQVLIILEPTTKNSYGQDYSLIQSSTLTDGRKYDMYISKSCVNYKDELVAYLKNIQSY